MNKYLVVGKYYDPYLLSNSENNKHTMLVFDTFEEAEKTASFGEEILVVSITERYVISHRRLVERVDVR